MEIIDYPNYLIYPDGKVYNQKYKRYLKIHIGKNGYYYTDLYKNSKRKKYTIHRLIALHYIPNLNNLECVDHKDGNKLNNDINNLRWVTKQQNENAYKSACCKSSIRNIYETKVGWRYNKIYYGDLFTKSNKNKQLVLWVKFVDNLLFS